MNALFSALPLLRDTMLILAFFFIVFSIAGLQLLGGQLKKKCISIQTGAGIEDDEDNCGGAVSCPGGYFCGKTNGNPNFGVTNYDSIFYAFMNTFQCVTLEGWSEIQKSM